MTIDLRLQSQFFVNKDIFFDSKVSRLARAIYVALCFLLTIKAEITLDHLAKSAGYNKQIARKGLNELEDLGFITKDKRGKYIGIVK